MAGSLRWAFAGIALFSSLSVYAILPIPTLHFEKSIIEEDDTSITCSIPDTGAMDVQLKIRGNVTFSDCHSSELNYPNVTCTLEVTKQMHEMEFTCEATFKTQSQPQKMYINTEPEFTDCPDNVVWIEGQQNSFHCKAKGYPPPTVTCSKDSTDYKEGEKFTVSKTMSGKYKCTATNFDTTKRMVTVSVQYKPQAVKVTVNPPLHSEGDNVTVSCEADGDPVPTYTWSLPSDRVTLSSDNRTVTVVKMEQGHLGRYRCTAMNAHGSATQEEEVTLQAKPRISQVLVNPSADAEEGQNITLTCEANGHPPPTYTWRIPADAIFSKDKRIITIRGAGKKHAGNYICTATNKYGSDTMTEKVTVREAQATTGNNRIGRIEPAIAMMAILMTLIWVSLLC